MVLLDHLEKWVQLASLVDLDFLVFLELKETLEAMVPKVVLECKDLGVNLVNLECLVSLVSLVHLEKMEAMEKKEVLECLVHQDPLDFPDQEDSQD